MSDPKYFAGKYQGSTSPGTCRQNILDGEPWYLPAKYFGPDIGKEGRRGIRDLQGRRTNIDVLRKEESFFKSAKVMTIRGEGGFHPRLDGCSRSL